MQDTTEKKVQLEANCVVAFEINTRKMRLHRFKEGEGEKVEEFPLPAIEDREAFERHLAGLTEGQFTFINISSLANSFEYRIMRPRDAVASPL